MKLTGVVMFNHSDIPEFWGWTGSIDTPDVAVEFGPYRRSSTGERLGPGVPIQKMQQWAESRGHHVEVTVWLGPVTGSPPADEVDE